MYIDIIKMEVNALNYVEMSTRQCLEKMIYYLNKYYEMEQDRKYLICIVLHLQAYLEMGYDYSDNEEYFNNILERLGTDKETMFPKKFYHSTKIKLNKSQVRSMIGKWSASNSMSITEVVDDIIEKVKEHKQGIYYYRNNRGRKMELTETINGELYELIISEKDCYFHDIKRKKYFTFI